MEPACPAGTMVDVDKYFFKRRGIRRGDIVVFERSDINGGGKGVKRVVGLPGDGVLINETGVHINSQVLNEPYVPKKELNKKAFVDLVLVPANLNGEGTYMVLGDNEPRDKSLLKKYADVVPESKIIGRVFRCVKYFSI